MPLRDGWALSMPLSLPVRLSSRPSSVGLIAGEDGEGIHQSLAKTELRSGKAHIVATGKHVGEDVTAASGGRTAARGGAGNEDAAAIVKLHTHATNTLTAVVAAIAVDVLVNQIADAVEGGAQAEIDRGFSEFPPKGARRFPGSVSAERLIIGE
jgi:hypothetical protein